MSYGLDPFRVHCHHVIPFPCNEFVLVAVRVTHKQMGYVRSKVDTVHRAHLFGHLSQRSLCNGNVGQPVLGASQITKPLSDTYSLLNLYGCKADDYTRQRVVFVYNMTFVSKSCSNSKARLFHVLETAIPAIPHGHRVQAGPISCDWQDTLATGGW